MSPPEAPRGPRRLRARVLAPLVLALTGCGGAPPLPAPASPSEAPPPASPPVASPSPGGHVRVTFLDVGQGDAALVTTDDGASLLVDLGPKEAAATVERAVAPLGHVDVVLVSHAHADHVGDLGAFARRFPVGAFWESAFAERPGKAYVLGTLAFAERRVPHVVARGGMHLRLGAHADIEVLAPVEPLLSRTRSDPNANSVVVRLTHAGPSPETTTRFLFTGDAEGPTEARLLAHPDTLAADVLKVAHHGSKHATSAAFLRAVHPKWSVISCGYENDYGHPHLATLKRLVASSVEIHRTDLEGDVTADSEAGHVTVTPTRVVDEAVRRLPGATKHEVDAP